MREKTRVTNERENNVMEENNASRATKCSARGIRGKIKTKDSMSVIMKTNIHVHFYVSSRYI